MTGDIEFQKKTKPLEAYRNCVAKFDPANKENFYGIEMTPVITQLANGDQYNLVAQSRIQDSSFSKGVLTSDLCPRFDIKLMNIL